jgi:hypothetical protein
METAAPKNTRTSSWRRFFAWYLETPGPGKSLILWWESRRLAYNIILFAWGIVNVLLGTLLIGLRFNAIGFSLGAYSFGMVAMILQVAANLWYTGGWVAGLIVRQCARGRALGFNRYALLIGTLFSFAFSECWYLLVFAG